jgi:hypothetical protein
MKEEAKQECAEAARIKALLRRDVDDLELTARARNALRGARIRTVGQLVRKTEREVLRFRNLGKKSLEEIRDIVEGAGLSFGMELPEDFSTDPEATGSCFSCIHYLVCKFSEPARQALSVLLQDPPTETADEIVAWSCVFYARRAEATCGSY